MKYLVFCAYLHWTIERVRCHPFPPSLVVAFRQDPLHQSDMYNILKRSMIMKNEGSKLAKGMASLRVMYSNNGRNGVGKEACWLRRRVKAAIKKVSQT